jgi:hypothetical protein
MSTENAATPARLDELVSLTEKFWSDLFRRDFDAVGAWFSADGN